MNLIGNGTLETAEGSALSPESIVGIANAG